MNIRKVELYILDVGFGDAILVKVYPEDDNPIKTFPIDTGRICNISAYDEFLLRMKVDYLILTHKHSDHIAYANRLIDNSEAYGLKVIFARLHDSIVSSGSNRNLWSRLSKLNKPGIHVLDIVDTQAVQDNLEDYGFRVLYPSKDSPIHNDQNHNSIILSLTVKDNVILFMGDATESEEEIILHAADPVDFSKVKILKVGHHGSSTSSSEPFIKALTDLNCGIISVSKTWEHHLPDDKFLTDWQNNTNAELYRTEDYNTGECHTIKFTIDNEVRYPEELD